MNCTICGKPVVLIPSAAERARKDVTGNSAQYYTNLFPRHATCELKKREFANMIDTMINVYDVLDWYLITAIVVFAIGVLCSARGG